MKKKNIVLIGFMGSGKSKVGKALARKLKMKYVDTDTEIEKREGKTIPEIFKDRGEAYFRRRETDIIKESSRGKNMVISAGGGAVLREQNVSAMKKSGVVVWLKATPETVVTRVGNAENRPLLSCEDKETAVRKLLVKRMPYYLAAQDVSVQTDGMTEAEVVEEIIKVIREQGTGNREDAENDKT